MISEKMISMLNEQMHREYESAYLYLAVANYYEANGLCGFARWFKIQAQEEQDHAMLFYEYLHLNDAKICFRDIQIVCKKFHDFKEPLNEAAVHEEYITESIENIYEQAIQEKDFGSQVFLGWFIAEQKEEEHTANEQLQKLEMYGTSAIGLYELDNEYGKRNYHGCKKIKNMGL